MIRLAFVQFFVLFFVWAPAGGAEPAAPSGSGGDGKVVAEASAKETVPIPPKCELTYDVSSEVLTVPTSAVHPELFKQEYVAEFVMDIPPLTGPLARGSHEDPSERANVLLLYRLFLNRSMREGDRSACLQLIPEEHRPPKGLADALALPFLAVIQKGEEDHHMLITYRLFAPTPERAEQLVETLLCFYNYGLACPMQAAFLHEKNMKNEELAEYRAELKKAEATADECDREFKRLKDYEDVTAETLSSFRRQQREVEVDMAGIEARIGACKKVLERREKLSTTLIEHVETVKITAEIELVGLEARQRAISRIIAGGEGYLALQQKRIMNMGSAARLRSSAIPGTEHEIQNCVSQLEAWRKCPVKDGKVLIRPVKFVAAKE